jgi:hypothetical protein
VLGGLIGFSRDLGKPPHRSGWVVGDEPNVLFELAEATREE